jgi:N-acetylglucosamine kinase-like BadF-type ATPase
VKLFAGIDGGQSSTVAVVADERGKVLGRGIGGPGDEVGQGATSTRLRDAIEGSLADALAQADMPADAPLTCVVAGISGYDGRVRGLAPRVNAKQLRIVHDAPIAHAGALAGRAGIIAIAGTGSVVYGVTRDGRTLTTGGWGFQFGDEASAFWVATNVLKVAMNDEDCDATSDVRSAACEFFEVDSLREVQHAYAAGKLTRDRVAAFAQSALCLGDDRVAEILAEGGLVLARQVRVAALRLGFEKTFRLALVGGLASSPRFVRSFEAGCRSLGLPTTVTLAREEPAMGALRMAMA